MQDQKIIKDNAILFSDDVMRSDIVNRIVILRTRFIKNSEPPEFAPTSDVAKTLAEIFRVKYFTKKDFDSIKRLARYLKLTIKIVARRTTEIKDENGNKKIWRYDTIE